MEIDQLVEALRARKKLTILASAGTATLIAVVAIFTCWSSDSSWVKVRTHTFRQVVVDDGINSMNCMSGPWNECLKDRGRRR